MKNIILFTVTVLLAISLLTGCGPSFCDCVKQKAHKGDCREKFGHLSDKDIRDKSMKCK